MTESTMADTTETIPSRRIPQQGLIIVMIALVVCMFILPAPASTLALFGCGLVGLYVGLLKAGYEPRHYPGMFLRLLKAVGVSFAAILRVPLRINQGVGQIAIPAPSMTLPTISQRIRTGILFTVEIGVVTGMTLFATTLFQNNDYQLSSGETEWLTSSAYAAANGLREYGRIPLWQPYLEYGEPLLDNPFSFVMNPISAGPSMLIGAKEGLKVSVILTTLTAGLGGWLLGWTLGFGTLARVLLALLLVGKGNMHGMFNTGYYQLAASQAYFPWIIAGTVGIFRLPEKRWPPILLGVSAALLLFAGNIWYTLPMVICVLVVALCYLVRFPFFRSRRKADQPPADRRAFDWGAVKRLMIGGVVALGISAVTLVPMLVNHGQLTRHPPEPEAGWVVPLWDSIIPNYFNPDPNHPISIYDTGWQQWKHWERIDQVAEWYYSFVAPFWLVLLVTVGIPLYRPRWTGFWLAGCFLTIFFTIWGGGGNPVFIWLYDHVPGLDEWRFVGRALAVSSFWIAVLVAMRVNSLWTIITTTDWAAVGVGKWLSRLLPVLLLCVLTVGSLVAAYEVVRQWKTTSNSVVTTIHEDDKCVSWLRARYPDRDLAIWRWGYEGITTLMNNRVRTYDVQADFELSPVRSTIGKVNLTYSLPEFALVVTDNDRTAMWRQGYIPMLGSPGGCFYRKFDALSYAYTVTERTLLNTKTTIGDIYRQPFNTLPISEVNPVTTYLRQPDNIILQVQGSILENAVLTVQERAYPGWRVLVDGLPAKLESVGGQIGVMLPRDMQQHIIYFEYRPPLLVMGGWITLITAALSALYLLRADQPLKAVMVRHGLVPLRVIRPFRDELADAAYDQHGVSSAHLAGGENRDRPA
jgi:hypothetical protein